MKINIIDRKRKIPSKSREPGGVGLPESVWGPTKSSSKAAQTPYPPWDGPRFVGVGSFTLQCLDMKLTMLGCDQKMGRWERERLRGIPWR